MSDNTDATSIESEDSAVIQGFREREKALKKELKEQEQAIRAKIEREAQAKALMPAGYEGLAGYFEQEVDGDLTSEAATAWLAAKGVAASPDNASTAEPQVDPAQELASVTDLGASVAAASNQTTVNPKLEKMAEIEKSMGSNPGNLAELTQRLAQTLEG
jgi:hypothetical protein